LGGDAGLREIAEVVHDIDLKDNKFNRLEAPGLSAVIRGLADILKDDRKLIQQCQPIFDGLYESFSRESEEAKKKPPQKGARKRAGNKKKQSRRK
jgi:hypothetical protein